VSAEDVHHAVMLAMPSRKDPSREEGPPPEEDEFGSGCKRPNIDTGGGAIKSSGTRCAMASAWRAAGVVHVPPRNAGSPLRLMPI